MFTKLLKDKIEQSNTFEHPIFYGQADRVMCASPKSSYGCRLFEIVSQKIVDYITQQPSYADINLMMLACECIPKDTKVMLYKPEIIDFFCRYN